MPAVLSVAQASRIMATCRKVYDRLGVCGEECAPIVGLCIRIHRRALSDFQEWLILPAPLAPTPADDLAGLARREQG